MSNFQMPTILLIEHNPEEIDHFRRVWRLLDLDFFSPSN